MDGWFRGRLPFEKSKGGRPWLQLTPDPSHDARCFGLSLQVPATHEVTWYVLACPSLGLTGWLIQLVAQRNHQETWRSTKPSSIWWSKCSKCFQFQATTLGTKGTLVLFQLPCERFGASMGIHTLPACDHCIKLGVAIQFSHFTKKWGVPSRNQRWKWEIPCTFWQLNGRMLKNPRFDSGKRYTLIWTRHWPEVHDFQTWSSSWNQSHQLRNPSDTIFPYIISKHQLTKPSVTPLSI